MTGGNFWQTIVNSIVQWLKDFDAAERIKDLEKLLKLSIAHYVGCDSCGMGRLTANIETGWVHVVPQRLESISKLSHKMEGFFKKAYGDDPCHICRPRVKPAWTWRSSEICHLGGKLLISVPRAFQENKDGIHGAVVSYKPALDISRFCRDELQDQEHCLFGLSGVVYLTNFGQQVGYATVSLDSSTGVWTENKRGQSTELSLQEVLSHETTVIYLAYTAPIARELSVPSLKQAALDKVTTQQVHVVCPSPAASNSAASDAAQSIIAAPAGSSAHGVCDPPLYVDCYSQADSHKQAKNHESSMHDCRTDPAGNENKGHTLAWLVGLCIAVSLGAAVNRKIKRKKR